MQLTEEYSSAKILLDVLKYEEYVWEVIGDNKIVSFLIGLRRSFIKFPYYLLGQQVRLATVVNVRRDNVKWKPLVDPGKYCFLHCS